MIYLDHAATTPLDEKVLEAMLPFLKEEFGNASSVHVFGRHARAALEMARETIAHTLHADPKEIIFTSGGTESVNTIHKGVVLAAKTKTPHVIISSVEHHCVLDCVEWLSRRGCSVTQVPVDAEGWVNPKDIQKNIRPGETVLISIMAANNEVGTIEPFAEIGDLARQQGILFHMDAVQAYGKIPIDVQRDHIDFLSVSAHKIYGPKGAGFFYQRKGVELVPLIHGGGQERDLRGGTENVAGIVGLAEAAKLIIGRSDAVRLRTLTDFFYAEIKKSMPSIRINGPAASDKRVPGLINITLPGVEGNRLVQTLDAKGFAVSSGAACAAGAAPPSHVLMAMGRSNQEAKEGLRISAGHANTEEQLKSLALALPGITLGFQMMPSFMEDESARKF
jgi:cysteine desulfurase